ncbi:MAG TPA: hypothetical protein VKA91_09765 [Nitrososphaeraceae archaeon]|nr:hypothetical protein [Nitrososphaeraceae archaeon]
MTAKNVPQGVLDITSTTTRRPEMAHALIKPAREQWSINNLQWSLSLVIIFINEP